jgi:hypothetical protein
MYISLAERLRGHRVVLARVLNRQFELDLSLTANGEWTFCGADFGAVFPIVCDDPLGSRLPSSLFRIFVATVASGRATEASISRVYGRAIVSPSRRTSNDELDLLGLDELGSKQVRFAPPISRNGIDILLKNPLERPSGHRAWRGGSEQRLDSDGDSRSRGRRCREAEGPATGEVRVNRKKRGEDNEEVLPSPLLEEPYRIGRE